MRPAWLQVKRHFGKEPKRSAKTNTTGGVCEAGRDRYKSRKKRGLLASFVMIEPYSSRVNKMLLKKTFEELREPWLQVVQTRA